MQKKTCENERVTKRETIDFSTNEFGQKKNSTSRQRINSRQNARIKSHYGIDESSKSNSVDRKYTKKKQSRKTISLQQDSLMVKKQNIARPGSSQLSHEGM